MDPATQRKELDDLLTAILGAEADLPELLREQGFEANAALLLEGAAAGELTAAFIEAVHRRLIGPAGQDSYFELLNRRFGLDGEPPQSLDEIAAARGLPREDLTRLWGDVMEHCRTQKMETDLKKELKLAALAQLARAGVKPEREAVAAKLERLSNLHEAQDAARLDYEARRKSILEKVQAELDALEVEFQPLLDAVGESIEGLESEIRTDVMLRGESVRGGAFSAVYTKGRVTWDSRGIESYAEKHPELLKFRKEGAPGVTLRLSGSRD